MSSEEEGEQAVVKPTRVVKSYLLTSRRLTASIINWIALALGLPKAPLADMVEGKLSEDREPRNTQVDLAVSGGRTVV